VVGFGSGLMFYICSQRELRRTWFDSIKYVPALMSVGIGIAFNNAIAAIEGFFGKTGEFVRTPKFGEEARRTGNWRKRRGGFRTKRRWQAWAELAMALYLTACLIGFFFFKNWFKQISGAIPFLLVFIAGYYYVAFETFHTHWFNRRQPASPAA